jgi:hypothetical protein
MHALRLTSILRLSLFPSDARQIYIWPDFGPVRRPPPPSLLLSRRDRFALTSLPCLSCFSRRSPLSSHCSLAYLAPLRRLWLACVVDAFSADAERVLPLPNRISLTPSQGLARGDHKLRTPGEDEPPAVCSPPPSFQCTTFRQRLHWPSALRRTLCTACATGALLQKTDCLAQRRS